MAYIYSFVAAHFKGGRMPNSMYNNGTNNCTKIFVSLILCFFVINKLSGQVILNQNDCYTDGTRKIILTNRLPATIDLSNATVTIGETSFTLDTSVTTFQYGPGYRIKNGDDTYRLYFTQLPVITLQNPSHTPLTHDNPVDGYFSFKDTAAASGTFNIKLKLHGATSLGFPKKSYNIHLVDNEGNETDTTFIGMRNDDKWLLLAMWNETLRLNNVVSEDLWRSFDTLYYAADEPDASAGIRLKYVEVFLDDKYQGVYALAEDMDRKELKLKKEKDDMVKGELYDGYVWDSPVTFSSVNATTDSTNTTWGGWEVNYPDTTNWQNFYNLVAFISQSSNENFASGIFDRVEEKSLIDYYLFLNLIYANDNTGKNLYVAKYNAGEPYFFAPWDLDGTWGYQYNQVRLPYNVILSNNLYDRLWNQDVNGYRTAVADRWFSLRETVFKQDSLFDGFETKYDYLFNNGVYEREGMLWTAGKFQKFSADELTYMENWTANRLNFLDTYFQPYRIIVPITLKSFSATAQPKSILLS